MGGTLMVSDGMFQRPHRPAERRCRFWGGAMQQCQLFTRALPVDPEGPLFKFVTFCGIACFVYASRSCYVVLFQPTRRRRL